MKRPRHFILGLVRGGDGHVRVTKSERTYVQGGTRETHEHAADLVNEIDKECVKDPPQTDGERRMIVREAARKMGMLKPETKSDPPAR
jgi:uncharacterized protein YpuA (DUF1002 family)